MRSTVKQQVTLSALDACWGFGADTALDSSSGGKHRSEVDSGVFSNTEIWPRGGGHRDDDHEEEILQADSETKKKVTNKYRIT